MAEKAGINKTSGSSIKNTALVYQIFFMPSFCKTYMPGLRAWQAHGQLV